MYDAMDKVNAMYCSYKQENGESNAKHLHNFNIIVTAIKHLGGLMLLDEVLVKMEEQKDVDAERATNNDKQSTYWNDEDAIHVIQTAFVCVCMCMCTCMLTCMCVCTQPKNLHL